MTRRLERIATGCLVAHAALSLFSAYAFATFRPVPADVAGPLNERFQRACRRFYDQRRRAS